MAEVDEVLRALADAGDDTALVTIVGVRGSTYRREGAKLVVPPDGDPVGNISGGCLEGEVIEAARAVVGTGTPRTVVYDLTADDEIVWGWGLGCNGVVEVFVEPASRASAVVGAYESARAENRSLAVLTVLEGPRAGARLVVRHDGTTDGELGADAASAARAAMADGHSRTLTLSDGARAFVEVVRPPVHLVVCGAGHDALPMAEFGVRLGWRVSVCDDRRAFLTEDRFPGTELVPTEPADVADTVTIDERTYIVVMSHNFLRDKDYLRALLGSEARYIAMLGPARRLTKLLDHLADEGFTPPPGSLDRVHGPAGIDIGAEGPEEIAWAIVSEILAVDRRASGGFLRGREGPIHERPPEAGGAARPDGTEASPNRRDKESA